METLEIRPGINLRLDGLLEAEPVKVPELIVAGVPLAKVLVTELSEDVVLFNELPDHDKLELASTIVDKEFDFNWKLPNEYTNINPADYIIRLLENILPTKTQDEQAKIIERVELELAEFQKRNLINFLRAIIYIVDKLDESNISWGVGRGSSCASYVLHLIGLHQVDSVKYDIPLTEFFHD